jgi:hypothetical protein
MYLDKGGCPSSVMGVYVLMSTVDLHIDALVVLYQSRYARKICENNHRRLYFLTKKTQRWCIDLNCFSLK